MFDLGSFLLGRKTSAYLVGSDGTAYKKKPSLEFDGTKYIDTGIKPTDKTRIEAEFNISLSGSFLFGSRTSNSSNDAFALAVYESTSYPMFSTTQSVLRSSVSVGHQHKAVLGQNGYFIDGELKKEFDEMSFISELNIYLGALNQNGTADNRMFSGVFYSVKVYENGVLILSLQPCIRMSDEVSGMYDKVNGEFYEFITLPSAVQMSGLPNRLREFEFLEVI